MKHNFIILIVLATLNFPSAQADALDFFEPLVNRTWVAGSQWGNGSEFKQEIKYEYALNKTLVTAESVGFIDKEQSKWGHRNHGLRQWDAKSEQVLFWEYDVFGGLTKGRVTAEEKNIYYQYEYPTANGTSTITDAWEFVDQYTYNFKIGIYKDGIWEEMYLSTQFRALPEYSGEREDLDVILNNISKFSAAYVDGDHERISTFYTEDGKLMPRGADIIRGRSAIAKKWMLAEGQKVLNHNVRPNRIEILNETAHDYGYYEGSVQIKDGKVIPFKGKYVIIWKKVEDEWLIDIDIWNRID